MNILLIGEDVKKISIDIWGLNTNYTIITTEDPLNEELLEFIKDRKVILVVENDYFKKLTINDTLEYLNNNNLTPIFINKDNTSFTHMMYLIVEHLLPEAIEYTINENNEDYDEFLNLCKIFLWKEVLDDFSIRTSKRRSTKTNKKS